MLGSSSSIRSSATWPTTGRSSTPGKTAASAASSSAACTSCRRDGATVPRLPAGPEGLRRARSGSPRSGSPRRGEGAGPERHARRRPRPRLARHGLRQRHRRPRAEPRQPLPPRCRASSSTAPAREPLRARLAPRRRALRDTGWGTRAVRRSRVRRRAAPTRYRPPVATASATSPPTGVRYHARRRHLCRSDSVRHRRRRPLLAAARGQAKSLASWKHARETLDKVDRYVELGGIPRITCWSSLTGQNYQQMAPLVRLHLPQALLLAPRLRRPLRHGAALGAEVRRMEPVPDRERRLPADEIPLRHRAARRRFPVRPGDGVPRGSSSASSSRTKRGRALAAIGDPRQDHLLGFHRPRPPRRRRHAGARPRGHSEGRPGPPGGTASCSTPIPTRGPRRKSGRSSRRCAATAGTSPRDGVLGPPNSAQAGRVPALNRAARGNGMAAPDLSPGRSLLNTSTCSRCPGEPQPARRNRSRRPASGGLFHSERLEIDPGNLVDVAVKGAHLGIRGRSRTWVV